MKKVPLLFALISILFIACNKQENDESLCNVRLTVNDFEIYEESFEKQGQVKAARVDTSKNINYLTVAIFDSQGAVYKKVTHSKADSSDYYTSSFGNFHFLLPVGNYTAVAIGYWTKDTSCRPIITSPTVAAFNKNAVDCFGNVKSISISNTGNNAINMTLSRMVSAMNLRSTDNQTNEFDSIRLTLSKGSLLFNPSTGLARANAGVAQTFRFQQGDINKPLKLYLYTFLPNERETATFTLTLFGQQGTALIERVFTNVPLKRNRRTIASGSVFSGVANEFFIETTWETDTTIIF